MGPRSTKSKQVTLRGVWVQVHLWLGLTLGVVGALIGLSGSVLVYDHEIDAVINPQRHAITGANIALPFADYAKRATQALGGDARPAGMRLPDTEDGPVTVFARSGSGPFQRVYLDPPTGQVLDTTSGRDFLGWLHGFHESLTLREYGGREIVGVIGIAMLVSSLSGIYLWWPSRSSLGFRRGFTLSRNLHYTLGFWGSLVLVILAFTGIFLAYPEAGRQVVAWFSPVTPSARGIQAPEGSGRPIGPDEAVAIARGIHPDGTVIGIGLPQGPRGVYRINVREPGDTSPRSGTVLFIDPRTGAILHRSERATRSAGDTFVTWQRTLHEGSAFGPVWRFVTFLGGLLPPLLVATGLLIWLRSRNRRRSVAALNLSAETSR